MHGGLAGANRSRCVRRVFGSRAQGPHTDGWPSAGPHSHELLAWQVHALDVGRTGITAFAMGLLFYHIAIQMGLHLGG